MKPAYFEAYELWNGLSWFRVVAALANVAILTYMAVLLWRSRRSVAKDIPDTPCVSSPRCRAIMPSPVSGRSAFAT